MSKKIIIGSRGSKLALLYAHQAKDKIIENTNLGNDDILIKSITTKGDEVQNMRLTEIGGWLDDKLVDSLKNVLDETGSLDGTGWDLEDLDDIVKDLEEPIVEEVEEVTVKVGKYKVKVSKEAFEEWVIKAQGQVGKEKEDIEDLIAQRLEIDRL